MSNAHITLIVSTCTINKCWMELRKGTERNVTVKQLQIKSVWDPKEMTGTSLQQAIGRVRHRVWMRTVHDLVPFFVAATIKMTVASAAGGVGANSATFDALFVG